MKLGGKNSKVVNKFMRVLYYSELYPIRNNSYEYYEVSKTFCLNFGLEKIDSRLICNDDIFHRLFREGLLPTSKRVPLSAEIDSWIKGKEQVWDEKGIKNWIEYIEEKNTKELTIYLENIKKNIFDFDVIVIWGKNDTISYLATKLNFKVVYVELTPSRTPYFNGVFISQSGVNGDFISKLKDDKNIKEIGYPKLRESLLVPLQLFDDLNFQIFSPFNSLIEFIDYVLNNFPKEKYDIYIKAHPGSCHRKINVTKENQAIEYAKKNSLNIYETEKKHYINEFDSVVTVNSSVGFESVSLGKKVFVIGDACYKGCVSTYEISSQIAEETISKINKLLPIKFSESYFYKPHEIYKYLIDEFCANKSDESYVSPFLTNLSSLIEVNVIVNSSDVYIKGVRVTVDVFYNMYIKDGYVCFDTDVNYFDTPLFILEILNGKIISGMTCDKYSRTYKITSEELRGICFILIGASLRVIGKIQGKK